MTETLALDGLTFTIQRSTRRKTLGITVDGDGTLLLHAPLDLPLSDIEKYAHSKLVWVHTKLLEKEVLLRPARRREYVNGEGFYYLGQSYRLWIDDSPASTIPPLRLYAGRFWLRRGEIDRARQHFINWYRAHGLTWLYNRASTFTSRIGVTLNGLEVRDLGERWGICDLDGTIAFHWRVMMLPPSVIDYVIVHELVHLREPHHDELFWVRVGRVLPDYMNYKRWLAENGAGYDVWKE